MKAADQYSDEQAKRIAYLVRGYLMQTLTEKEHDELDDWVTASDENQELFEELMMDDTTEATLKKLKARLDFTPSVPEKKQKKARIIRYGVAASILLLASLATFLLLTQKNNRTGIVQAPTHDITAGGNRATLTTANGKVIDLTNSRNGLIDSTDGLDVLKAADGQLSYEGNKDLGKGFHILSTPAGGQYSVTLPDGSRVWLNAKSTLKYPVKFDESARVVELEGEAYFEIAHINLLPDRATSNGTGSTSLPFVVKLGNATYVEVLGTHFNVNAYKDEEGIETTLLEGQVNLVSRASEARQAIQVLHPGEMGSVYVPGHIAVTPGVDTSAIVAWKNGMFKFHDALIETIMKQVARWYDAEIVYEGKIDFHFNATIYRKENVSKLLEVLEETQHVHFTVDGKRIIVRP